MALVTKIMLGLIILAGGGGIFLGLSIPDKVEEMKTQRDKFKKSSSDFQTKAGEAEQKVATAEENLSNLQKEMDTANNATQKAKTDLQLATQAKAQAEAAQATAEGNLGGAIQAKNDAESKLAGAQQDASDWETKYNQAIATANRAGGGGKELKEWKALTFKGKPISAAEVKVILAAKEKAEAVPAKTGKVTKLNAAFGLIHINLGAKYSRIGQKYTVRRGTQLIGLLTVVRISGEEAICKLDKANSPGVPQVGDGVK